MATKPKPKTLSDFRAAHDKNFVIPEKIKAGLAKIGKDNWEYEVDFMKLCGVGTVDFAKFREQFEEFFVIVPGTNGMKSAKRVWAGSKAAAAKLREMV